MTHLRLSDSLVFSLLCLHGYCDWTASVALVSQSWPSWHVVEAQGLQTRHTGEINDCMSVPFVAVKLMPKPVVCTAEGVITRPFSILNKQKLTG